MNYSVEKAFTNTDIWENILKYFNLEEQLLLTDVCELFRDVITSLVWRTKCKELKLNATHTTQILVTDQVDRIERYTAYSDPMYKWGYNNCKIIDIGYKSSVLLNNNETINLLRMNQSNIVKLQILEEMNILRFVTKHQFDRLESLNLFHIQSLTAENLNSFKISCPNLKTLILNRCYCEDNQGILQDQAIILVIAEIKMLKSLIVIDENSSYECNHIKSVVTKLQHLTELIFKINIKSDITANVTTFKTQGNCKILSMPQQVLTSKSFIKYFEHLGVLAITSNYCPCFININFMENLIMSCNHLKNLYLEFCNLEEFIPVPSIETLSLSTCSHLNWKCLKTILSQTNLLSLTSVFTTFSDNYMDFSIKSPLEYLRIETLEYDFRDNFRKLLLYNSKQMNKLNTLIWHDYTQWYDDEPITMQFPLKDTYLNLQTLIIDLSVVNLEDILKMKCLKQLALIENDCVIDLYSVLSILNHPNLKSFSFYNRNLECFIKSDVNNLICKTNVRLIKIPLDLFNKARNIWVQLLSENLKLKLVCYFYERNAIDFAYLSNMLRSNKFPRRIKSIQMCDFTIDCNQLQKNKDDVIAKISVAKEYSNKYEKAMYLKI